MFTTDQEFSDYFECTVLELVDIHLQNKDIIECSGEYCYYCERNLESPQNYKKVKGLRID